MACLSGHHKEVTNGVGKCSVPMWCMGAPAGFCDEPAYGPQDEAASERERRGGDYGPGWRNGRWFPGGVWRPVYCSGLACYAHGGPKAPENAAAEGRGEGER